MSKNHCLPQWNVRTALSILLVLAVGRLVWILEPFGVSVDESTYMAIAEAWHHYGRLYVDAVDRKPPFLYGLYDLIGNVFGFWNIHGVHFCYFLIAFLLCWLIDFAANLISLGGGQNSNPAPTTPRTGLLYAIISASFTREFVSCNSEVAMMVPLALAFLILFWVAGKPKTSIRILFACVFVASALGAVATLFKEVAALPYAFAIIAWSIFLVVKKDYKAVACISIATLLGVTIVYGLLSYGFYRAGSFHDLVFWNLIDNFSYVKDAKLLETKPRPIFSPLLISMICWPVLWWGSLRRIRKIKKESRAAIIVILYAGTSGALILISVAGRLFSHYFVPFSWFMTLFASAEVSRLFSERSFRGWVKAGLALPFCIFFALTTFRDEVFSIVLPGKKVHSFDRITQSSINRISEDVKKMTSPSDRIVVWGMASQIYVESQRGSGTRFIPADYASGRLGGFASKVKNPAARGMKLYLQDIENKKPLLFVDTSTAKINDYQYFPISDYPELQALLNRSYEYIGMVDDYGIWKRK